MIAADEAKASELATLSDEAAPGRPEYGGRQLRAQLLRKIAHRGVRISAGKCGDQAFSPGSIGVSD